MALLAWDVGIGPLQALHGAAEKEAKSSFEIRDGNVTFVRSTVSVYEIPHLVHGGFRGKGRSRLLRGTLDLTP
jgi:hypothetical protein